MSLSFFLVGVLYNATVVPCPVTMAVVNIGASDAKVESLFSDFLQLREDAHFAEEMGMDAVGGLLGEEDEDEHYGGGAGEEEGGKKETKKKAVGSKARAGSGGAKKAKSSAAKKPRSGGVKKGGGKGSRSKGKTKK